MGDEYVSVEHIFLSLIDRPNKEGQNYLESMELREKDFLER